jgi:putative tryptophan/tyrosine transport system substrate-binding protein
MEGLMQKACALLALIVTASSPLFLVHAQTAGIRRVGIVRTSTPPDPLLEVFLQGLRDAGYVEGKNIQIELRFAEGKPARAADLMNDLVREKQLDAIFTASRPAIIAFKKSNSSIPLVMVSTTDPIRSGIVASLAQPGGNITGVSLMASDLWPKRLELLKEVIPKASKVAIFWNKSNAGMAIEAKATEEAAGPLGVALQDRGVKDPGEIDVAFDAISKDRPDALLALMDLPLVAHRTRIIEFLEKNRLPAIFETKQMVEAGGLISYGPSYADVYRRAAIQMDKILKGAKPSTLPVEQPTKFEFFINLKTAKQIGLTIPPNVLARADRVIR